MGNTVALIVAAGRGERAQAQAGAPPKQYWPLAGKPVLRWTVETFASHPAISTVQVVIRDEDRAHYEAATKGLRVRPAARSEERRVGKECRSRWSPYH